MKENRGFFDIEIEEKELLAGTTLNEYLDLKELQQRKLHLNEEVDQYSVADIVKNILQYNTDDKEIPAQERDPVFLYVASNGGNLDAGFELIDVIMASKTPVYTINMGNAYSMGFLISLAGHKRFAFKNAKFLCHDGQSFVWNSGAKVQDQIEFNKRIESKIKAYILGRTNIQEAEYDAKFRVEWYMLSDEAKRLGVVDYIIGEDCELDEVI